MMGIPFSVILQRSKDGWGTRSIARANFPLTFCGGSPEQCTAESLAKITENQISGIKYLDIVKAAVGAR